MARDHVTLDCTQLKSIDLAARFPGIYAFCASVGSICVRDADPRVAGRTLLHGRRTDG